MLKVIYLAKDNIYINENDRIVKKEFSYEKGIATAVLSYENILNLTFKLSKNIEKDMLEIEAEKYVFTEGSLDYSKDYKINYYFKEFEDYINVEAFTVETEKLKKEFEEYLKIYKYIDFISVKPFVFQEYYELSKTNPKNDIFIYFTRDEAFLSCFENGEFVFVKSISKLSALAKQLDKSIDECMEILTVKGLDESAYDDENEFKNVESFFSQFFMKVNNLANYSTSYYGLSKIDRIFFYSSFEIKNLYENYTDFWNLSGIEFKKYELATDYDAFDYTAVFYNSRHYKNENENFSIFPKPESFYKTKTGVLTILILLGILFIGYDTYAKYKVIQNQQNRIFVLKKKIARKSREERLLGIAVKKLKKENLNLINSNKALEKQIGDVSDKIIYLDNIRKNPLTANILSDLINGLKKYNLKLLSFEKDGTHINLLIVSGFDNSSNVAEFMKYLYKSGYKNIYSAKIDNKKGVYISEVSYDE